MNIKMLKMKKGFTLIELLVVIAIIGILAALIIVSLSGAREKAQDTQRKNNARNIDTALAQFFLDQSTNSYPAHALAGGTIIVGTPAGSEVPLGLDVYLTGTAAYGANGNIAKYISAVDGTTTDGKYAQAWELASDTEATVLSGNGVYAVSAGTYTFTSGNTLDLVGIGTEEGNAFVTYGPQ